MLTFLAEQFLVFRPRRFVIETGSTLFLLIICATMLLPFFLNKKNDNEAGFLKLAQTLKASKECQKECGSSPTIRFKPGCNTTFLLKHIWKCLTVLSLCFFFLSGGGQAANDYAMCLLIENGSGRPGFGCTCSTGTFVVIAESLPGR